MNDSNGGNSLLYIFLLIKLIVILVLVGINKNDDTEDKP